jgi:hypothetical protein
VMYISNVTYMMIVFSGEVIRQVDKKFS